MVWECIGYESKMWLFYVIDRQYYPILNSIFKLAVKTKFYVI